MQLQFNRQEMYTWGLDRIVFEFSEAKRQKKKKLENHISMDWNI